MIELMLNPRKRDNYAFFDPESRLHLTAAVPRGSVPSVTSAIQRGLNTKVLIKIDRNPQPEKVQEPAPEEPEEIGSAPELPAATVTMESLQISEADGQVQDEEQDEDKSAKKRTRSKK